MTINKDKLHDYRDKLHVVTVEKDSKGCTSSHVAFNMEIRPQEDSTSGILQRGFL